jgi:hypothetical protein
VLTRFPFLSNSRSILLLAAVENDNFSIFLVISSKAAIFKFLNSFNELNFPFKFRSREALYESDVSFTEILDLSKFKPAADPDEMLTFNSLFLNSISALIF